MLATNRYPIHSRFYTHRGDYTVFPVFVKMRAYKKTDFSLELADVIFGRWAHSEGKVGSVKGDELFLFLFFICCTLVDFRAGPGLLWAWILVTVPKQGMKRDPQSGD